MAPLSGPSIEDDPLSLTVSLVGGLAASAFAEELSSTAYLDLDEMLREVVGAEQLHGVRLSWQLR